MNARYVISLILVGLVLTNCSGKRKMEVYYRAKDQDVAVLIKEFDYELNEGVEPRRDNIWKT
jgi:hypothetical protein